MVAPFPTTVSGDHGGRPIGSYLGCDRPVIPPRCTSVGNNLFHGVVFDETLTDGLASSLRDSLATDYGATKMVPVVQPEVTDSTDVIAYSEDYGDNGAAGWVYCPADAPLGTNFAGDRWCQRQRMHFNLNPRYAIFFADDASRDHVTCHELGHTVGLRHWGNALTLEIPLFGGDDALAALQADVGLADSVFLLRNKGESALAAGMSGPEASADGEFYRLMTLSSVIEERSGHVVLPAGDEAALASLEGLSFHDAVTRIRRAGS